MPWDPGQKWENKPSTATPLSADRLNSREKSITDYVDEQIDNHTHIIDQVDGLANALANKADVGHTHATLPSEGEKAALAGTAGTPGISNRYVTAQDPLRPPLAGGAIQATHVLTPAEANATLIHRGPNARTVVAPDHLSPAGTLPEGAVVRIARDKTAGPVVIDKAANATLIGPAGTTAPYIVAAGGVVRLHRVQGGSGESLYVVEGDLTVAPRLPDPTSADEGDVLTIGSGGPEWAEPQGGGNLSPDALTAAGVPVLLGQDVLPDGVNMSVDATQSMQFLNIEGLEVAVAGPVIMEYQNAFELTEPGEVDHHFTIQPDGGPVQPTEIVWVQRAETLNQQVPITWRIAVDLQPGTYKFGWRCVVLSGKVVTSDGPGTSQMTVYTCPPTVANVHDYTHLGS